jgi:hypothetical protein
MSKICGSDFLFHPKNRFCRPLRIENNEKRKAHMTNLQVWQGRPNAFGGTVTTERREIRLFSENATAVDLGLLDSRISRKELQDTTNPR